MKKILIAVAVLIIIVGGGAFFFMNYGSKAKAPEAGMNVGGGGTEPAEEAVVKIKGFAFNPATVIIKKGGKVTWINEDSAPHKIVAEGLINSPVINSGDSFSFTFPDGGEVNYICGIHTYMSGKVEIKD